MSINKTQKNTSFLIQYLDDKMWENVADKAISKMPKYLLKNETQKMIQDFVYMNNQKQERSDNQIREDYDNLNQKQLNPSNSDEREIEKIREISEEKSILDHINNKRLNFSNEKIKDYQNVDYLQTKTPKKCIKVFMFQPEEETGTEALRRTKLQNTKFYQNQQQKNRQKRNASEEHSLAERKKYKEMKTFTYDYEGRFVKTDIKGQKNLKLASLKSKFIDYKKNNRLKNILDQEDSRKINEISNKRIVLGQRDGQQKKISKPAKHQHNNSLLEFFNDKDIQIGVSVTDFGSKSKIYSKASDKLGRKMKLSQFQNFTKKSYFKQRASTDISKIRRHSESHQAEQVIPRSVRKLKTQSDIQSKNISVFSKRTNRAKNIGNININNSKLFNESLYNDEY